MKTSFTTFLSYLTQIKHPLFIIAALFYSSVTLGQGKIGLPQQKPDSSAVLDLSNTGATTATYRGLLLPQVALSSTIVWGMFQPTLGTVARNGLMVFNTATAGSGATIVSPGIYYWYNGQWIPFSTATQTMIPNCGAGSFQSSPSTGALFPGYNYNNTYTLPYASGNGTAYNSLIVSANGLSLTRVAGTFAAGGGNMVFNLTGTYKGMAGGTAVFPIGECSAGSPTTATFGTFTNTPDYIRQGLSSSATTYDAAAVNNWIQVTAAEYNNVQTIVNSTTVGGETNTVLNTTPTTNFANNAVSSPNCFLGAGNYLYGFSFTTPPNPPGSISSSMISVGMSTTSAGSNGTFTNFPAGAAIPAINAITANTRYYFLLKKPSSANGSTTYYCGFYSGSTLGAQASSSAPSYNYSSINGSIPSSTQSGSWSAVGAGAYYAQQQFLGTTNKQW